eukprot:1373529-Prymnesium_polylepis.1
MGGAIHVLGGASVRIEGSLFAHNSATESGGGLQVDGGHVHLLNETAFVHNVALLVGGSSILFLSGTLQYTLPTPPGRWLSIRQGVVLHLESGPEDLDFPYACPAGVVGGSTFVEMSRQQCSRPWCDVVETTCGATHSHTLACLCLSPSGHYCPSATIEPTPCEPGEYQPESGAVECRDCKAGQSSIAAAAECTVCTAGFYRPTADSSATECVPCTTVEGTSCPWNATIRTLRLSNGYWRHSARTLQTFHCKSQGDWTPCLGGGNAGHDGDGYCAPGHAGPRCELCNGTDSQYFDQLDARCHDCSDAVARIAPVGGALFFLALTAICCGAAFADRARRSRVGTLVLKRMLFLRKIWLRAGMRPKVKALIGLYQCVAAIPSVYDVVFPPSLVDFTEWVNLLELPSDFDNIVLPGACFGSYDRCAIQICVHAPAPLSCRQTSRTSGAYGLARAGRSSQRCSSRLFASALSSSNTFVRRPPPLASLVRRHSRLLTFNLAPPSHCKEGWSVHCLRLCCSRSLWCRRLQRESSVRVASICRPA